MKLLAALAFVALNFYIYAYLANDEVLPPRETFDSFPLEVAGWRCPGNDEMDAKTLRILGATDYWICTYFPDSLRNAAGSSSPVSVYVGYHESQVRRSGSAAETVIHPPEHCLPGAGWGIIDSSRVPIDFLGLPEGTGLRDAHRFAKRFVIAKGEARQLVYFWYQGQGRVVTANEDVILWRFFNRARRGRTDGALVRFTTPILRDDVDAAETRFASLASQLVPLLPAYVPD